MPPGPHLRRVAIAALLVGPACAADATDGAPCSGKCDGAGDLADALDGRGDPVARWIREQTVASNGSIKADFEDILGGVRELQGCAESSLRTFVVSDDLITGEEPFPRLVSVACAGDNARASEFFIAASFELFAGDGDQPTGEIDTRALEMFAWDEAARTYRFYATEAVGADPETGIRFEVEPARCRGCHLTPTDQAATGMPMTPIMNELTRPWTHWNAEPGFPSHEFEVPDRVEGTDSFAALAKAHLGPATDLEQIIRAGHDRVALTRMRARRDSPPSLEAVMALLRPVFCEEQINYVSEEFDSGILPAAALVDPGIRTLFMQVKPSWTWDWVTSAQLRLTSGTADVDQTPVRGNADTVTEAQLGSLGVLPPAELLRVRALDWQRPVFSDFRCRLWRDASKRFEDDPPDLAGAVRNSDAIPIVFDAVMTLDGKPLATGDDDLLLVVPVADGGTMDDVAGALGGDALAAADCQDDGFCALDLDGWGDTIDAYLKAFTASSTARTKLRTRRAERICHILETVVPADDRFDGEDLPIRFNNRPSLPAVSCN
jgi:hypothetical protein